MREKHRKNTNTKGNNTQIVTKTNQIFINNSSSVVYNRLFYRKKEREVNFEEMIRENRSSCENVSSFHVVVAWWDYVEASFKST